MYAPTIRVGVRVERRALSDSRGATPGRHSTPRKERDKWRVPAVYVDSCSCSVFDRSLIYALKIVFRVMSFGTRQNEAIAGFRTE